jgi:hypothetical protein
MALAKGEQNYSDEEKAAIVPLIDVLLSVGATWEHVKIELYRVASTDRSPFKRVPCQASLENMLLSHYGYDNFTDYREKQKDRLKSALKGKAVNMALSGNVPMLIFCLKNLCNWSDNVQVVPPIEEQKNMIRLAYDPKSV